MIQSKCEGGSHSRSPKGSHTQKYVLSHLFYSPPNSKVKTLLVNTEQKQTNKNNNTKTSLRSFGGL